MRGTSLKAVLQGPTFSSLRVRNYRLYFVGQLISVTGVWMQVVALSWLVLELTGSGTSLGLVIGTRFLPVLILGPWGGLLADRFDKRMVLRRTAAAAAFLSILLGVLAASGSVEVWMVYVIAGGLGLVNVLDGPARQSFISEMVGPDQVRNAVTLNSVMIYIAQIAGPALAGIVIALTDVGLCFIINGLSSVAVIVSLRMMDAKALTPSEPEARAKGQIRAGLAYVWHTPELLATIIMIAVGGIFAWEFQITVPLLAKDVFDGDAGTVGLFMSCMGAGAVVGGLLSASRPTATARTLAVACMLWGVTLVAAALTPTLVLGAIGMAFVGFGTVAFSATSKSTLQLGSVPHMRGRVMALWAMCVSGSTPIGAPIVGWIGENIGPRWGLIAGGLPVFAVGAFFYVWCAARMRTVAPIPAGADLGEAELADAS
jgi:MFS family permease